MSYAIRLGRTPIGDNLITNGDFSAGMVGWTFNGQWTLVGTDANYVHGGGAWGNGDDLTQANVFTPGKWYRISWDAKIIVAATQDPFMTEHVGSYGSKMRVFNDFNTDGVVAPIVATYTIDRFCISGTDFSVKVWSELINPAATYYSFTNFTVYELDYNTAFENPESWQQSNKVVKRSDLVDGIFVTYINNVNFWGDDYDYILQNYTDNGLCGRIPVKIDYMAPDGTTTEYYEGIIYQSECIYDSQKKIVSCSIEDVTTSLLIQKGKDRKIRIEGGTAATPFAYCPDWWADIMPDPRILVAFNDGTGNYGIYTNRRVYKLFEIFQRIVLWATDFEVNFESDLLTTGTFQNFSLAFGKIIRLGTGAGILSVQHDTFNVSFGQLVNELNALMPVGFLAYKDANNIPTIKLELRDDLYTVITTTTLTNIRALKFSFDKKQLYQSVEIGYKNYNTLTPFVRGSYFMVGDTCGEEKLTLLSEYVQSSVFIYLQLLGSTAYDEYLFWMEINAAGTQTKNDASQFYNPNIDVDDNQSRWLDFMQTYNRGTEWQKNIKSNQSFLRVFEFDHELNKSDFDDIINNPFNIINISGSNISDINCYLYEIFYPLKGNDNSLSKFKLLGE